MTHKIMRRIRDQMGYTQSQLAELLGYKSYHSISEMESNRRKIPKTVAMVLSQINYENKKV